MTTPLISILVSTYNRKELVKNALDSIFMQTFQDYEIFLIDDQSTDGTQEEILKCYPDQRLKYIYNEKNQAAEHGDKIHIKRFVHDLATGKYWIYLDSDDRWLSAELLERQIKLFAWHPDVAMVTGGQQSYFVPEDREHFEPDVFPEYLDSDAFLEYFANDPIHCNIIGGARLYDREMFIRSGALVGNDGRWESGYELTLAPACYGGQVYINEPCIRTEIRPENASFGETQLIHYLDSVASVKAGFRKPLIDFPDRPLDLVRWKVIYNIGQAYLGNSRYVLEGHKLSYCSPEHLSRLVTAEDVNAVEEAL